MFNIVLVKLTVGVIFSVSSKLFVPKKIKSVSTSLIMTLLLLIWIKERGLEQLCLKSLFIEAFYFDISCCPCFLDFPWIQILFSNYGSTITAELQRAFPITEFGKQGIHDFSRCLWFETRYFFLSRGWLSYRPKSVRPGTMW